ncbi:hypothetical protein, partial [Nocardia farcinica]|uniref:hypothetical protein n=1 Tax=Nocardia farcinica TaxID=37329 RepID=UPI002453B095
CQAEFGAWRHRGLPPNVFGPLAIADAGDVLAGEVAVSGDRGRADLRTSTAASAVRRELTGAVEQVLTG